jgi:hypothetical protein
LVVVQGVPEGLVTKQKVKVKLDLHGTITLTSAQALEETKDEKEVGRGGSLLFVCPNRCDEYSIRTKFSLQPDLQLW